MFMSVKCNIKNLAKYYKNFSKLLTEDEKYGIIFLDKFKVRLDYRKNF